MLCRCPESSMATIQCLMLAGVMESELSLVAYHRMERRIMNLSQHTLSVIDGVIYAPESLFSTRLLNV